MLRAALAETLYHLREYSVQQGLQEAPSHSIPFILISMSVVWIAIPESN